jgi:hypothetical protein
MTEDPNALFAQAVLDDIEDREATHVREQRDEREARIRWNEQRSAESRQDRLMRQITNPSLTRALDHAAVRLTERRMRDLEVKIGESLTQQVKDGVREAFNQMERRGHRAYAMDLHDSRDYVRCITVELPTIAYRIYQRFGTWEWVG